jgi:MoxR-like ATPase
MSNGKEIESKILTEISKAVIGKDDVIKKALAAILAGGHILLEDIPGVGKTTLAVAISKTMSLHYNRMQFTPDVMPSDVIGFSVFNKEKGSFQYKNGVIMCNLFLADEINRTSSKTQSALLEAMEEGKVTVDGITRELPNPFTVIATQNPIGSAGTTLLPDSQLDRFMVRLSMGYPQKRDEINILKSKFGGNNPLMDIGKILGAEEIVKIREEVSEIFVHDAIYDYIVNIVTLTRNSDLLEIGISPRGTVAIVNISKAMAYLSGRNYVIPEDVIAIIQATAAHRIILSTKAKISKKTTTDVLNDIVGQVSVKKD